jgi:hypothetical protein
MPARPCALSGSRWACCWPCYELCTRVSGDGAAGAGLKGRVCTMGNIYLQAKALGKQLLFSCFSYFPVTFFKHCKEKPATRAAQASSTLLAKAKGRHQSAPPCSVPMKTVQRQARGTVLDNGFRPEEAGSGTPGAARKHSWLLSLAPGSACAMMLRNARELRRRSQSSALVYTLQLFQLARSCPCVRSVLPKAAPCRNHSAIPCHNSLGHAKTRRLGAGRQPHASMPRNPLPLCSAQPRSPCGPSHAGVRCW